MGTLNFFTVSISSRLEHFEDALIGLRAEVAVNYNFVIQRAGEVEQLEINLTAFFEQEFVFSYNISGGAVWKIKWIFPYIADFRMTASLDLGTYTGIGITATAKLTTDDEDYIDIFGMPWIETPDEAHYGTKLYDLTESIKKKLEVVEKIFPEAEGTTGGGLTDKYATLMEDANDEWVYLVEAEIFSVHGTVDPLGLLAFGLEIDFVVSANLNVALGMTFSYENYKRHSFTLWLFSKEADSDTVDLSTNSYRFDMYVMGTLGIRAGIRAKATVGLFSTRIAGIGLQIEAGAYLRMWGYFYYSISNFKENGVWNKQSGYTGAACVEFGLYLDLKFIAEALNGKYSYAPTLYYKEYPLWTAGQPENVIDFAYDDGMTFNILSVTKYKLPSSIFDMYYMDLKTGESENEDGDPLVKNFDSEEHIDTSKGHDEKRFVVELSNPNFKYNPNANEITIENPDRQTAQECEMTLTWKHPPMSGSSEAISRTILLKWDNTENASTTVPML